MAQKKSGAAAPSITRGPSDAQINRFTLQQYFNAVRAHKGAAITTATAFTVTAICFGTFLPYALAHAVDLVSQRQGLAWGSELTSTLLVALGVTVAAVVSNAVGLRGFIRLDSPTQNDIRATVFDRLMNESATFYANTMTGALTSHVAAYTNSYAAVQDTFLNRVPNLILPLVVGIFIIAFQSPLLAGCFAFIGVLICVKTLSDSKKRAPYRRARKEAGSQLSGFVGDVIANNAAVRAFAGEHHERRGLGYKQATWQLAAQANMGIFSRHYIGLVGSINILQVAGIGLAAWLAATGSISLGLVVFAIAYFQRLSSGLLELAPMIQNFQGALMDASPISEILMAPQTLTDKKAARQLRVGAGELQLTNVSYQYEPDGQPVFSSLSLHISAGQSVGLVGRSGGGKTTLTNLILRFADVTAGAITIDGQNISHVSQRSLRQAISYVPQDSSLFHRSIFENIAYGRPNATESQVIDAAKKAHIWSYIKTLPDGLATKVGERGVKLSGGQRQRIAIARAILKNAPILVFDEATSALDSESEQHIQQSLTNLMKNRTSIVIAHRLSTIQKLDRIIVLDNGTIAEDGSHEELLKKNGLYAALWSHQSGGFIE